MFIFFFEFEVDKADPIIKRTFDKFNKVVSKEIKNLFQWIEILVKT